MGGGISLLKVVGKVVARIVQNQLQKLAEKLLPESQCGFTRKGRGCNDMIFVIWELSEKAIWNIKQNTFCICRFKKVQCPVKPFEKCL